MRYIFLSFYWITLAVVINVIKLRNCVLRTFSLYFILRRYKDLFYGNTEKMSVLQKYGYFLCIAVKWRTNPWIKYGNMDFYNIDARTWSNTILRILTLTLSANLSPSSVTSASPQTGVNRVNFRNQIYPHFC